MGVFSGRGRGPDRRDGKTARGHSPTQYPVPSIPIPQLHDAECGFAGRHGCRGAKLWKEETEAGLLDAKEGV